MSVLHPCDQFNRNLGLIEPEPPKFPLTADERFDLEFAEAFGEPEPQPPAAPESHVDRVADAAIAFMQANVRWLNDARRRELTQHPPYKVLQPLAQLFAIFAEQPVEWPRTAWPFLYQLRRMAELILPLAPQWFDEHLEWPTELFLSDDLDRSLQSYTDPPPAPERRVAAMEPLAELMKLAVSDAQLCRMADWYTPQGAPDLGRLRRAIADPVAEPWPTMIELEPVPDGLPDAMPLLGIVYDVGAMAAQALAAE